MDVKEQMIEAYERGTCSYEGAYEHVRGVLADNADHSRKAAKENGSHHEDSYWLGRFAMAAAMALPHLKRAKGGDAEIGREGLRGVLEEFLASPSRHPTLKGELRKARRGS